MSVLEQARGRWPLILTALGLEQKYLNNRHGPCPGCGGEDRYRFDNREGKGTWFCNQCGHGDGMDLAVLATGKSWAETAREVETLIEVKSLPQAEPEKTRDPRLRLRKIHKAAQLATGSVLEYLSSRKLKPASPTRLVEKQPHWEDGRIVGYYDCMAHLIHDAQGRPATYHMVYLHGGKKAEVKAPKKLLPPVRKWAGGAARLYEEAPVMGVTEGIENAMAAYELTGIPTWAAINAWNLREFTPPECVSELVIFADHDRSFTGQAAAYALAQRVARDRKVRVMMPVDPGSDFCDILEEGSDVICGWTETSSTSVGADAD